MALISGCRAPSVRAACLSSCDGDAWTITAVIRGGWISALAWPSNGTAPRWRSRAAWTEQIVQIWSSEFWDKSRCVIWGGGIERECPHPLPIAGSKANYIKKNLQWLAEFVIFVACNLKSLSCMILNAPLQVPWVLGGLSRGGQRWVGTSRDIMKTGRTLLVCAVIVLWIICKDNVSCAYLWHTGKGTVIPPLA